MTAQCAFKRRALVIVVACCMALGLEARLCGQAGALDPTFSVSPDPSDIVCDVAVPSATQIIVNGAFGEIGGVSRQFLARLGTNGAVDPAFDPGATFDGPYAVAGLGFQTQGRLVVLRQFVNSNFELVTKLCRFLANGSRDADFQTLPGPDYQINAFAIQPDNRIVIVGDFNEVEGRIRNGVARLLGNGALDTSFSQTTGIVECPTAVLVQSNGKIIVAGVARFDENTLLNPLVRLNSSGSLDTSFAQGLAIMGQDPSHYAALEAIAVDANGRIYVGGQFVNAAGVAAPGIVRLKSDGTLDPGFDASRAFSPGTRIRKIRIASDGKIFAAGSLLAASGASIANLARLDTGGYLDPTFDILAGAGDSFAKYQIMDFAFQSNGRIIAALHYAPGGGGGGGGGVIIGLAPAPDSPPEYRVVRFLGDGPYPPHRPRQLVVSSISPTLSTITWNDVAGETGYRIERRRLSPTEDQFVPLATVGPGVTSYDDTNLIGGENYEYRVCAFNQNGDSVYSPAAGAPLPDVPQNVAATLVDFHRVDLTWTAGQGQWRFDIYRATDPPDRWGFLESAFVRIGTAGPEATVYSDLTVGPCHTYLYRVDAVNIAGNVGSGIAEIRIGSDVVPDAPRRFYAAPATNQTARLAWTNVDWEDGYRILRRQGSDAPWLEIAQTLPDQNTFNDPGPLNPFETYQYSVRAFNAVGDGAAANPATITAQPAAWVPPGTFDPDFVPTGSLNVIFAFDEQPSGPLVAFMKDSWTSACVRILPDGGIDRTFSGSPGWGGDISDFAALPDGRILIASTGGNVIGRYNANGSRDVSFNGACPNAGLSGLFVCPDDRIFIHGGFSAITNRPGVPCSGLARLLADGAFDNSFDPTGLSSAGGMASQCALQSGGAIIVVVNGRKIVRLDPNGARDMTFGSNGEVVFDQNISVIAVQADDKILVGGRFSAFTVGGQTTNSHRLARLTADGAADPSFDIGSAFETVVTTFDGGQFTSSQSVADIALQPDGRIIVAGYLIRFDGIPVPAVVRLLPSGDLDLSFQPSLNPGAAYTFPKCIRVSRGGMLYAQLSKEDRFRRLFLEGRVLERLPSLSATPLSASAISLKWDIRPEGNAYDIERWIAGGGWHRVSTVTGTNAHTLASLVPATQYRYRVVATFGNERTPVYSDEVTVSTYNAYDGWKFQSGVPLDAPDFDDRDRDTVPLVMEYALGLNPNRFDRGHGIQFRCNSGLLELRFLKAQWDAHYIVECSTNLIDWTTQSVSMPYVSPGSEAIATTPAADCPQKFLRLRVTRP